MRHLARIQIFSLLIRIVTQVTQKPFEGSSVNFAFFQFFWLLKAVIFYDDVALAVSCINKRDVRS